MACNSQANLFSQSWVLAEAPVTGANGVLFVSTSNGVDNSHDNVPAPDAPSFLAVDQETGDVLWSDNSPGSCILHGQWSSPAFAIMGGIPQVIFAGGDGWVYSFGARGDGAGNSRLLWKFDCNPKDSVWRRHARGTRGNLIATPVIHKGLVYIATGLDPEQSAGRGHLWCIDPIHRSCGKDVSPELAVDADNAPLTRRRIRAVDAGAGERSIPNPDSAAVWHYAGQDRNADGTLQFDESLHHTLSSVAIHNNLVILPDMTGVVHCLDARSGHAHWTCDLLDSVWASPLIVDGKIHIATAGGNVAVFRLSADPEVAMNDGVPIVTVDMGDCIHATPIVAENVLYVTTSKRLYAIGGQGSGEPQSAGRLTNLNAEDE